MSGLTPKKKEELKQMMGKYSGKVSLSLLSLLNKKRVIISTEESLEDIIPINWSEDVLSGKKRVEICGCEHDFMRMQYADEEFKCSKCGVNRDDLVGLVGCARNRVLV